MSTRPKASAQRHEEHDHLAHAKALSREDTGDSLSGLAPSRSPLFSKKTLRSIHRNW